ncbi:PREDICTED: uncharacterized protein LOC109584002 [Amphimedon queenslandica]|uniref:Histone-lysine N-methyltransferase, H3 lysine-79 specific n=1 Tax=Amphimedon queenslandica TaxID=400682 RepID=A0A1X7UCJ0_AMPQE|nr:PREDICTED: uncharacterized protein LOC109584002 [Amphimedon queenslandica]|eukprot:XP_019855114.1 PREDICTED: uncharacterized protein LOC109584002 [Amphimedon queenslandica]
MPETRSPYTLTLHSPATSSASSSSVATYHWPLQITESWNEAHEIAETVRWVCSDFPELETAVQNCIFNHFDPSSFESMKMFCEKYNRAVDNIRKLWSGRQPPPCIDVLPSSQHLKHIITQIYNRSVKKPEDLNQYEPFSPEVYGETSFELIQEVIATTRMTENDVFLDLGSGVGQIVLQVAASVGCKCYGIEKADIPAKYAETMDSEFVRWMDFYGKSYGEYELLKGDFMDPKFEEIFNSATVLFCNNYAFGPDLNHRLTLKFQNLRDGVKIVSSREFCPLNFRLTERKLSDIGAMMRVVQLSPLKGKVSWTDKPVSYYLHMIDRTVLEEFFHKQKHAGEKSEGSTTSLSGDEDDSNSSSSSDSESSSSSSEGSSLDSTNEDLFPSQNRMGPVEHYHFPPSSNQYLTERPHPIAERPHSLDRPHPLSSYRKSMSTSTSSVPKKSTPPVGSTHLPHPPHPHVPHPKRHRTKVVGGAVGVARGGAKRKRLSKKEPNSIQLQHQGTPLIDHASLNRLFDSFRQQNEAYLSQLGSSSFAAWLTDAAEKEKMKRKHLTGVIEHLESEVKSLSQETIQSMKKSMLSLGITDLTPEGLLCGAKDIVALNRQLRKEVELLEREVVQLKEQHHSMNGINCHSPSPPTLVPPPPPPHNVPPPQNDNNPITVPPSPPLSKVVNETPDNALLVTGSSPLLPNEETTSITIPSLTPPTATPTEIKSEAREPSPPPIVSILCVEEAGTAEQKLSELSSPNSFSPPSSLLQFEIRLETIDQAVLELGPFAKEVHQQDRLGVDSVSMGWNDFRKDKMGVVIGGAASVVPPLAPSVFKSGEIPPVTVAAVSSLKGVKKNGRRKKEEMPSWTNGAPPILSMGVSVAGGDDVMKSATPPLRPESLVSETTSVAEAMLALGHAPNNEAQTTPTPVSMPALRTSSGSVVGEVRDEGARGRSSSTSSHPLPPLPSLSRLPPPPASLNIPPPSVSAMPPSLPPDPAPLAKNRTGSTSSLKSNTSSLAVIEDPSPPSNIALTQYEASSNKSTPPVGRSSSRDHAPPSRDLAPPSATSGNPFLPPNLQTQTDSSAVVSFPYSFGWNQPLYRTNFYPAANPAHALTYGVSADSTHSLDTQIRPLLSPYLFRYPYTGAMGTHSLQGSIPLGGVASAPFQPTTLSSPPSRLSAFKTLHQQPFNRSLTPPTLHPLVTAQGLDKVPTPTVGDALNPWFLSQYPSAPAGGVAFPFGVLSQQATPTIPPGTFGVLAGGLQTPPTSGEEKRIGRGGKRGPTEYYTSTVHDKPSHEMLQHRQTFDHSLLSSPSPSSPRLEGRVRGGGAKSESRSTPRLKIHQMNNEDFQATDKGTDRRRRRPRISHQPNPVKDFGTVTHVNEVSETPPTPEEDMIDVTSIDPSPHPLLIRGHPLESDQLIHIEDSPAPPTPPVAPPTESSTAHTSNEPTTKEKNFVVNKNTEKEEELILLSDQEGGSSEGTVSASPSPLPLSPPPVSSHTSFLFSQDNDSSLTSSRPAEETKDQERVGNTPPVTTAIIEMATPSVITEINRHIQVSGVNSSTTDSHCLQPSNKVSGSRTTTTIGINTASIHQPPTTVATIATTNDTSANSEGLIAEKERESHTTGEKGGRTLVTDNTSSLIGNSHVTVHSDTTRPDDANPQYTNSVNGSSITESQSTSTSIVQSNTTSLLSTPPLSQTMPTPLINTITISHSEDESSDKEKGSYLPIDMSDISGMRFEFDDSEEKSLEITSLHSSSPGSDHAHLSLNSNPPPGEEEEEGEILSVDDLEVEEKEEEEEEGKRLEEDKVEADPEDVFQDGGHNPHSSRLLSSSSCSSDALRYHEDRISLSVDDRLSPPTPQKTLPTSNMLPTSTANPIKEKRNFFSLDGDKSTSQRFNTIDIRIDSEDISREGDETGFEVKPSEITSNNFTSTVLTDDISSSQESLKKKKKRLLNRDFTKHSQSRTISTAIASPPSSTIKQSSTQIKERPREKSLSKHSSKLHVHHVEEKHRHHRHRHRHHGDRLTTPPSRHEQHGGSSERKGHHRSPRPRPHVGEEQLSPHRSHAHNRMKRHSPSEDRTHHKKTSHTHSSAHYHHDHNHCSGRSHSSTPVSDHYESGRVFDKPHPHRTKESSPSWNSDGPEDGRVWSHHHGDHRKRRGSEGSGEDVKYKKRKHHKNHDESRYYNKEHQPTSVPY